VPGRSRYSGVPVVSSRVPDGRGGTREVRHLGRRRLPPPTDRAPVAGPYGEVVPLAHHRVTEGDRLDLLAARYLGDPLAAWQVCDANGVLDPEILVAPDAVGRVLVILPPEA
jgi:hypothetical protein